MINVYEIRVKATINNIEKLSDNNNWYSSIKLVKGLVNKIIVTNLGLDFHNENTFKYYTFNGLNKLLNSYVEGEKVIFTVRTTNKDIALALLQNSKGVETNYLKIISTELRTINKKSIDTIYTLTPVLLKSDDGYWRSNNNLQFLEDRIKNNLIKKYNKFFGVELDVDFELFESIEVKNRKPISFKYKDITLLADKFVFTVAKNSTAQELIRFALGTGLGENNSEGCGFILPKYI